MREKLIESVKSFFRYKIAVVGDIALDCFLYGFVERINPENPGAPLIRIDKEEYRLGCAGNVAENLVSLHAVASLYTVAGKDNYAEIIKNLCKDNNIFLFAEQEGETIRKQRVIEEEHGHYISREDFGESKLEAISRSTEKLLFESLDSAKIDALILSDYNKHLFRGEFGRELIALANSKRIPTIVDPKPVNIDSFYGATLICPNIHEARQITDYNGNIKELTKRLKEKTGSEYVIITRGKEGLLTYDGSFYEIPTHAREVTDVTGAGDTVAAVLTLGLVSGLDIKESAQLANYAAGIVVEKAGTSQVSQEELIDRINEDHQKDNL